MPTRLAPAVLCLVFVASGAAGLIYESIWSRYLGLFVGHSAYAQVIVLAIFLGGMSAGAMLAGRRSESLRQPLLWYAGVELCAGLVGLAFHPLYLAVTGVAHDVVFAALGHPTLVLGVEWTLAAALILPQSILLGTTFPFMSAGVLASWPMHRSEPWGYLRDLFCLLSEWPITRVLDLAPANWAETSATPATREKLAANIFRRATLLEHQRAVA